MRRLIAAIAVLAGLLSPVALQVASAAPASAATLSTGDRVLNMAESRQGDWYSYGSAGPSTFDCSGLVYWAAGKLGISLARTTYGLMADKHLYRIPLSEARRGDLLFYGTGHVEIDTVWYHQSFGAHHTGTRVGWQKWSSGYAPTMAFRFR